MALVVSVRNEGWSGSDAVPIGRTALSVRAFLTVRGSLDTLTGSSCAGITRMQAHRAIWRVASSRFPIASQIVNQVKSLCGRNNGRVLASSPDLLDDEYARGRWAYLDDLPELARYAVISGYCAHRRSAGSVLDLGCGTGVLFRWLHPNFLADYVGVDLSQIAIQQACREAQGVASFVSADIGTYEPGRRFDVIVFNEVLYYFADPLSILQRYMNALEREGVFVISLWESPESHLAWQRVAPGIAVIDAVEVRNECNVAWRIRLCRPASS